MTDYLKDVIVSIPTAHKAQLESWLLGHGYLADHHHDADDGSLTFYRMKELSAQQRDDLSKIGAAVFKRRGR